MMNTLMVGNLILAFFLDLGVSKKHHVGPCLVVTEPEPCPDPDYIQVFLFTRDNPIKGQYVEFYETTDNLTNSFFVPQNSNKVIIHGFNTDMYLDVLQDIKSEYLKHADANIWMVNYPKLVENSWCYLTAAQFNIKHVGICLAQFVTALRRHHSDKIHFIGFSLGAQVTNYLANTLGEKKLDRITGLDPAGPWFTMRSKKYRLDSSDAKFVDIVHTNAGMQGDIERCGHIDFYMNGGISQPGCFNSREDLLNCNHRRAPQYFAESINTKIGFLGWKCEGFVEYMEGHCKPKHQLVPMGEDCPSGSLGFYIVNTASEKPFALGNWTEKYYHRRLPKMGPSKASKNRDKVEISINDSLQRIFLDIKN